MLISFWLEKPETARRVRQRVATVLDWAYSNGMRSSEAPLRSVNKGLPRQPKNERHFVAMPYAEIPNLMKLLAQSESVGRMALKFTILTAARSGEVRGAVWNEIADDLSIWTIPATRMKAGKEHIIPLSKPAQDILDKMKVLKSDVDQSYVFPGNHGKQMSDMTLMKALRSRTAIQPSTSHLKGSC